MVLLLAGSWMIRRRRRNFSSLVKEMNVILFLFSRRAISCSQNTKPLAMIECFKTFFHQVEVRGTTTCSRWSSCMKNVMFSLRQEGERAIFSSFTLDKRKNPFTSNAHNCIASQTESAQSKMAVRVDRAKPSTCSSHFIDGGVECRSRFDNERKKRNADWSSKGDDVFEGDSPLSLQSINK